MIILCVLVFFRIFASSLLKRNKELASVKEFSFSHFMRVSSNNKDTSPLKPDSVALLMSGQLSDKEIVDYLLSDDPAFVSHFFYKQCKPMLTNISSTVFNGSVSNDELANDLYYLCREDDWKRLKSFSYKSSLYSWLKVVAVHHFCRHKRDYLGDETYSPKSLIERLTFDYANESDIKYVLSQMSNLTYQMIIQKRFVEQFTKEEMKNILALSSDSTYQKKELEACQQFVHCVVNSGSYYEQIFIEKEVVPVMPIDVADPIPRIINKMDMETLLNLLPNDRYRLVIDSLILKDKKREDVAESLGITVQNLDNIKSRALKKLAEIVKNEMNHGRF